MSQLNPGGDASPESSGQYRKPPKAGFWEYLSSAGLAEPVLRLGTHIFLIALILLIAWGLRIYYSLAQTQSLSSEMMSSVVDNSSADGVIQATPRLPFLRTQTNLGLGVSRQARLHTYVPSRARLEVIAYLVQPGDTLFGLATRYGIRPETILWANQQVLGDNPHNLRPGQEIKILPVDGAYHRWSIGDSLMTVANYYGIRPEDIINFPGNHLEAQAVADMDNPDIAPGMWLIIPGGRRDFVSWSAPDIPRDNPGVAKVLGPGACETIQDGMLGSGVFIWPADSHFLSGFDYEPGANHYGIDITGQEGDAVYAADSGVVVYAGWNNWGYGYVVVINHGNGWQTLYAHLNSIYVSCGQSVEQSSVIGAIGATGNVTDPNLHFEMMYKGERINPHNYID